jgi:hypothetical protein
LTTTIAVAHDGFIVLGVRKQCEKRELLEETVDGTRNFLWPGGERRGEKPPG